MRTLNTIVPKSIVLTSSESNRTNTVWDNLLAEARFAGSSRPEREDAIQRIEYVLSNYEMRDWKREVLEGIISVLKIEPRL